MKYTIYHLVANQGGRYTKHIYIGGERVVSKIGDFASYGSDPRRIQYAGSEADAISVDYAGKYSAQQEAIKENYATFDVPYNGTDNNDYVNGEGFCCDDGSMEAAQTRAMAKALEDNFQEGDAYENLQFYYHSDHLGSSSYITNLDGEVVQHIEYVPFGEVFIEERNNIWNTPYLFNANEFDEETGLYYYGARYYDPRLSLWLSTDPLEEKYPQITSYCFTNNNPLRYVDLDGNDWVEGIDGRIVWRNSVTVNNYQSVLKNGETYRGTDYVRYKEWNNTLAKGLVQEHYKSDKVLHYEKHNGVFQMDFTGSVVTAKELTGKSLNPQRNAEFGIVGTAYLNAVFSDGGTYTTATYQFASGPYGNGPTPNHNYTAYNVVPTNESGMQIYGETGWKVYIENYNGRDGLRIHPDTNSPGTAGCIGIHGTAKELKSLGKFFQDYIKTKGKNMKINFNIPNNPNYGNNGKANSNIGQ